MKPIKPLLPILMFCVIPIATGQNCKPVDTDGTTGSTFPSGRYCLNVNLKQPEVFDIHSMRYKTFKGAGLLSIINLAVGMPRTSGNTLGLDLDLQNHTLEASPKNMIGVRDNVQSERVYLHNGSIIVPGAVEPNIGIDLQALQSPRTTYSRLNCARQDSNCGNPSMANGKVPPYRATGHIVEKVNVRAGWLGVQMAGIGNTIRNSVIEVDSRSAIALFGPGSVIENNTIIVHGKGEATPDDGAVTLWDGKGSIIRNNHFVFEGWLRKPPPAIRLIDSTDVLLEGNTFEGFDERLEQAGTSSYRISR